MEEQAAALENESHSTTEAPMPQCHGLSHRWPADYSYGDTCMCGTFYLDTRKDGVVVVTEVVHGPTCDD